MRNGSMRILFAYDASGMRIKKTVNETDITNYTYHGKNLVHLKKTGGTDMHFYYDDQNRPSIVNYNGSNYAYVYNLQGDVMALLDSTGAKVVEYAYNAWGKLLNTSGSMASTLGVLNPFRYRGYIYDEETGYYYLRSRYYYPNRGRLINADSIIAGAGGSIQGYNMFAYCFNNPVNMSDSSGHWPQWIKKAVNWVNDKVIQPIVSFVEDVVEDFKNFDSSNQSEEVVFSSNYFSNYNGALVVKAPFDTSFSFGFIGLSTQQQNTNTLKHEYGHTVQMKNMGIGSYITDVAIPSITINILERKGKLPYDYYSYPWEAEANKLGEAALSQSWKPPLPQGEYTSYWDLIPLFFE